jgi:hypothetical protein
VLSLQHLAVVASGDHTPYALRPRHAIEIPQPPWHVRSPLQMNDAKGRRMTTCQVETIVRRLLGSDR